MLSGSSDTTKSTTYATTRPCGWWRDVSRWTYYHPFTNHNSSHGRIMTQIMHFILTLDSFLRVNGNRIGLEC